MATAGFPGTFQASTTIGYLSIGAVQKRVTNAGFPGTFQASTTIGYLNIGAVQKIAITGIGYYGPFGYF